MSALATELATELVVKATLLLLVAALAAAATRRASAAARHAVWAGLFAALVALPAALAFGPRWRVPLLATPEVVHTARGAGPVLTLAPDVEARSPSVSLSATPLPAAAPVEARLPRPTAAALAALLWALGTLACLLRIVAGRVALGRIARRAAPADGAWRSLLHAEAARAGVRAPVRLLVDAGVAAPATWGVRAPVVVLPAGSDAWPETRRRAVLRHELAHVARRDALLQSVAGVACALYWFHPGVWLAARRLVAERERACDDRVLALGSPAADYAADLLDVARLARTSGLPSLVTVSMARRTELEGRLLDVLDPRRARGRPSRAAGLAGAALASVLVVTLSAFRAVPRPTPSLAVTPAATAPPLPTPRLSTPPFSTAPFSTPPSPTPPSPARQLRADSSLAASVPARSGERLTLDIQQTGGSVEITGTDDDRVTLRGSLGGRSWPTTRLTFERWSDGVRLRTTVEGGSGETSFSHHFVLRVPRRYDVRIASAGGDVTVRDLEGSIRGSTGGGQIRVERASGDLSFTTGGGDVFVFDSRLTGRVSTGGGAVLIDRVVGGLTGHSGSGDITYAGRGTTAVLDESAGDVDTVRDGAGGVIRRRRDGGTISIPSAPDGAVLYTGGGSIDVGPAAGLVSATTGGGAITLGPVDGSAEAHTGAGDVTIRIAGRGDARHDVYVTTGNGGADVWLPADISARLDIETAYTNNFYRSTRIDSDWDIPIDETRDWDAREGTPRRYVRSSTTLGGGRSLVRVRVVNGDIRIHRY